jgi:hypothetical protein
VGGVGGGGGHSNPFVPASENVSFANGFSHNQKLSKDNPYAVKGVCGCVVWVCCMWVVGGWVRVCVCVCVCGVCVCGVCVCVRSVCVCVLCSRH